MVFKVRLCFFFIFVIFVVVFELWRRVLGIVLWIRKVKSVCVVCKVLLEMKDDDEFRNFFFWGFLEFGYFFFGICYFYNFFFYR